MENNKFKITIYFLVVIIFIIGSYFGFQYLLNPRNKIEDKNIVQETNKEPEKTELYWQEKADEMIKTSDFGKCEEIEDELYKKVCVNNIALNLANEELDIGYCQKLDNELVSIADCVNQVIFAKSMDKEDIEVCGETNNQELQKNCEDSFWLSLAIKKEDISLCENKAGEKEQNICHNSYLLQKEFSADTAGFDCEKFKGSQGKADCDTFKKDMAENNFNNCGNLKSELFNLYCQMSASKNRFVF